MFSKSKKTSQPINIDKKKLETSTQCCHQYAQCFHFIQCAFRKHDEKWITEDNLMIVARHITSAYQPETSQERL